MVLSKHIIEEGLSSRLFHFCPLSALYQIAEFDAFRLTPSSARPSDREMTSLPVGNGERKYFPYYMCFSRTPSSLAGYVAMRRDKGSKRNWLQTMVRIEVDGDLLSRYYKGMPVNYFTDKNDEKINHHYEYRKQTDPETGRSKPVPYNTVKGRYGTEYSKRMTVNALNRRGNIVQKDIRRYTPHMDDPEDSRGKPRSRVAIDYGVLDRNQMSEYEDRLFSYTEYIRGAHKFIKRIDIYIAPSVAKGLVEYSADALYMIREIMSSPYGKFTHIYTNQGDFETFGKSNKVGEFDWNNIERSAQGDIPLTASEIKTIVRYAVIIAFQGKNTPDWKSYTRKSAWAILTHIGLHNIKYSKNVRELLTSTMEKNLSDIESHNGNFFAYQTKSLKKELEEIAPYKYRKYISPIDEMARKQIAEYEKKFGKRISIFQIKTNLANKSAA